MASTPLGDHAHHADGAKLCRRCGLVPRQWQEQGRWGTFRWEQSLPESPRASVHSTSISRRVGKTLNWSRVWTKACNRILSDIPKQHIPQKKRECPLWGYLSDTGPSRWIIHSYPSSLKGTVDTGCSREKKKNKHRRTKESALVPPEREEKGETG